MVGGDGGAGGGGIVLAGLAVTVDDADLRDVNAGGTAHADDSLWSPGLTFGTLGAYSSSDILCIGFDLMVWKSGCIWIGGEVNIWISKLVLNGVMFNSIFFSFSR